MRPLTGYKPFSFFEPGILSLPMGVISFVLIISLGPLVLPDNKGGLFREVREHGDNLVTALDITQARCQHLRPDCHEIISNWQDNEGQYAVKIAIATCLTNQSLKQ